MTLADFLLARIAEDEQAAHSAAEYHGGYGAHWRESDGNVHLTGEAANAFVAVGPFGGDVGEPAEHIARHDPARVLTEVEAKRRQIALLVEMDGHPQNVVGSYAYSLLWLLALPYADHPDYRQEWRP